MDIGCKDKYHEHTKASTMILGGLFSASAAGGVIMVTHRPAPRPSGTEIDRNAILRHAFRRIDMARRWFLRQMIALPFVGIPSGWGQEKSRKQLNIMMKSAWGSDDPTKAAFPFLHGLALAEAGHSVQIFLLGEAVSLMRSSVAAAVVPVGWPPLGETMRKVADKKVQIYACGACSRARSVLQPDLDQWGAKFGNPAIFVSLVEWADRVITE
jgi:predicted peroxiredoxin